MIPAWVTWKVVVVLATCALFLVATAITLLDRRRDAKRARAAFEHWEERAKVHAEGAQVCDVLIADLSRRIQENDRLKEQLVDAWDVVAGESVAVDRMRKALIVPGRAS